MAKRQVRETVNGFFVEFEPEGNEIIPDGKIENVDGDFGLRPGMSLSCGPIRIGGRVYSVRHIRTARTAG